MNMPGTEMLTAVWTSGQEPSTEAPESLYWASGRTATLADYRRHELDTYTILEELPMGLVKYMWPGVVAEVRFEDETGAWMLRCPGHATVQLDITDQFALDDQIQAEVCTLPVVFRVRIIRG